jgi:hypothetical protein
MIMYFMSYITKSTQRTVCLPCYVLWEPTHRDVSRDVIPTGKFLKYTQTIKNGFRGMPKLRTQS